MSVPCIYYIADFFSKPYIAAKASEQLSEFQHYLLGAPTMDAEQYAQFKENRKHFERIKDLDIVQI